jgi:hypothetical protein
LASGVGLLTLEYAVISLPSNENCWINVGS